MATQELNVKFKVDASDVTSGSKEAKDKVKDAANQMAQDVKSSSDKMEQSFKDVAKSTDAIKDATKTATTAVKTMETQVDSSAKNMEKSMDAVSKKMNVMMGARGAATALRMGGNAIQSIGPALGMSEGAASTTGAVLNGAASGIAAGAQLGTVIGGPGMGTAIGAAAGGLMGAASELFKAGQELNKAAAAQSKERRDAFKDAVADLNARQEAERVSKENQSFIDNLGSEDGMDRYNAELDARTKSVIDAQKAYDEFVGQFAYLFDPSWTGEKTALSKEEEEQLNKLKEALETAKKSLENFTPVVVAATTAIEEQNKVVEPTEEEKRRTRYETAAQQAADEDEMERMIRRLEAGRPAANAEEAEIIDDELAAEEEKQKKLTDTQDNINGLFSRSASSPTDALTKMGGGFGYTSYNNSVERVQETISENLKKLVQSQTTFNTNIENKLDQIINNQGTDGDAVWQKG